MVSLGEKNGYAQLHESNELSDQETIPKYGSSLTLAVIHHGTKAEQSFVKGHLNPPIQHGESQRQTHQPVLLLLSESRHELNKDVDMIKDRRRLMDGNTFACNRGDSTSYMKIGKRQPRIHAITYAAGALLTDLSLRFRLWR